MSDIVYFLFRLYKKKGFTAKDMERDLRRMTMIRKIVGDDFKIALDANQQWTLPQAIEICSKLAPLKPYWIEEPTHAGDVQAHATLAKVRIRVTILILKLANAC